MHFVSLVAPLIGVHEPIYQFLFVGVVLCDGVLLFVCCVEMKKELCEAVKRGDIQSVTRLLQLSVDINTRDEAGVCVVSYNVCIGC